MANKFNADFLKSQQQSPTVADFTEVDTIDRFKSTADIFSKSESVVDMIATNKLIDYANHPFKIREGERLEELTLSIKEQGVLVPLIVRCHPSERGNYEILAGHHRKEAAKRAGIDELPCIVKNADDTTATLIMVESNKQRGFSDMLPSEIAKALQMEYDALKCRGKRSDLLDSFDEILMDKKANFSSENIGDNWVYPTSVPVERKLESRDKVAKKNDISSASVRRYIRLNNLTYTLLELVDTTEIAIRPAVDLSYLKEYEQSDLYELIIENDYKVDMKKAEQLKKLSQSNQLTAQAMEEVFEGKAKLVEKKTKKVNAIKLPYKLISEYVDTSLSPDEIEGKIITALAYYKDNN